MDYTEGKRQEAGDRSNKSWSYFLRKLVILRDFRGTENRKGSTQIRLSLNFYGIIISKILT